MSADTRQGDALCIHCGNVPLFPVAVMAIVAIGGCASLGGYDDVVAASTGSNSSLQQLSAYYRRIQPKAVIVPPQFTGACLPVAFVFVVTPVPLSSLSSLRHLL
jgi:hypothetical protein